MKPWAYVVVTLAAPQLWAFVVARALASWERRKEREAVRRAPPEDFKI